MVQYSEDQLIKLGKAVDELQGAFDSSYADLMENSIIKENQGKSLDCILELLGQYLHGIPKETAHGIMYNFLAGKELWEMPDYIDDPMPWKSAVARWRLSIGL